MLELTTRGDQFVLVFADQAVAGHGLEVRNIAYCTDVSPSPLDAKETIQEKLVGHIGKDATNVDVAHRAGFDGVAKSSSHHGAVIAEVAPRVTVGPSGFQEQFLQTDSPSKPTSG